MKRFLSKGKKGFTIVELVIVIGVIGILSAILIPTFVNLNANAQRAALKSDLAAVYSSYVADVADGYYGETEDEAKKVDIIYGQQEVYLSNDAENFYTYGEDGWKTDPEAKPSDKDGFTWTALGGNDNTYTSKDYLVYTFVENTPNP